MLQLRFIGLFLFLVAFFTVPALTARACEMHRQAKPAVAAEAAHVKKHNSQQKAACCDHASAARQQKDHCTHDNCTDNSCHPVSVYSLHTVNQVEIAPLPAATTVHRIGRTSLQLSSYAYAIWQPPRLS